MVETFLEKFLKPSNQVEQKHLMLHLAKLPAMVLYRNTQQDLSDIFYKIYFLRFYVSFNFLLQSKNLIAQSICVVKINLIFFENFN